MDEYSTRRAAGGLIVSRRGPSFLRDSTENNRDRNVQVCSRVGCSSKLNQIRDGQFGSPSKSKALKTPFRAAHGKEIVGSSSRSSASSNTSRKSSESKNKLAFHLETESETSSLQYESEEPSISTPVSGRTQTRVHPEPNKHESADAKSTEAGTSTSGPTNRPMKRNNQRFGLGKQNSAGGSSASFAFKQTNQGARNGAGSSRYNLRHLRCDSISDVVQSGSSSSPESSQGRKRDNGRKRIGEPESSLSARGKKMNGPMLDDRRNDNNHRGVSISDSRRTRNLNLSGDDDPPSARNRRSTAGTRLSNQENRNRLPLLESPRLTQSSAQADMPPDGNPFSSESQFSAQTPSYSSSSFSRPGGNGERMRPNRSVGPYEIARSLMNRDTLRQYNLDGIAEMLLALDGVEQDEEPTYEQLLVMETHLFLGGLAFQDQHREMRLDIDNMSYEELLALTERIGTVSTAVPEEVLAKCLKRSIYQANVDCRENEDDIKCCICQEEYADGDEVGRLACDHRYHTECVNQWLRLKSWCPICKVSAAPSPSASTPL